MNVPVDVSKTVLHTERLTLRPWRLSDLDDFYEYASVDGVGQMAGWLPHKNKEESLAILQRFIDHKWTFCIEYSGKAIGSLGIEKYDEEKYPEFAAKRCREIGYVLSKDHWGRGLMPEAVKEVIRYSFEELELDLLLCGHFLSNTQSGRVQEKCGFKHYSFGTYKTRYGSVEDHETTVLTRGDWLASCAGMDYQDVNALTIDRWVEEGWEWGKPVNHEVFEKAINGDWDVMLTPTKPVPHEWFGEIKGKKILGLACGGGQQMPVFAALGADCTVFDYSVKQLESEKLVSQRENYDIEIIRGDMTKPLPFPDETFDLIFHPVSNCYAREVKPIWKECYRVLKKGGVLLAGMDNSINYIVGSDEKSIVNRLPFDPVVNADQRLYLEEDDSGMQFSHTLEEQIGGQLEAGFTLIALYEDTNGEGYLHDMNIPSYIATCSVKRNNK